MDKENINKLIEIKGFMNGLVSTLNDEVTSDYAIHYISMLVEVIKDVKNDK